MGLVGLLVDCPLVKVSRNDSFLPLLDDLDAHFDVSLALGDHVPLVVPALQYGRSEKAEDLRPGAYGGVARQSAPEDGVA
jgi:hypothetical protein